MLFDIDQTEGERFQFFGSTIDPQTGETIYDEPAGDAYVTLRPMQPFFEERLAKRKKSVEHVLNQKTRQMERISYYPELSIDDAKKERDEVWDYAITNIENFKDKYGKVIECTKDNKIKLIKVPVFERFCSRCLQIMSSAGVVEKEAEEKN